MIADSDHILVTVRTYLLAPWAVEDMAAATSRMRMRHAWAARRYYRIRVASGPAVGARHKEGTGARLQQELIQREDSGAGWECRCQCRNGLIHRREDSEGHRKGLGDHNHRGWEALDPDGEGLDKVPKGEGVPGRVQEGTARDRRGGEVQGQDQEGLDHLDGLAQVEWGVPRHRAMPAGVQVGMEAVAVADMEGTGGRETGRLK